MCAISQQCGALGEEQSGRMDRSTTILGWEGAGPGEGVSAVEIGGR